jgi:hypothetical protein
MNGLLVAKGFITMSNPGNPNDRNQRCAASAPGRQVVTQRGQENEERKKSASHFLVTF